MPTYERLTDRTLATGVTINDLIHIVITGDTSQNSAGSSYKATIKQVATAITQAGEEYLPLSGGTITGSTTSISLNPNVNGSQLNVSGSTGLPMIQASIIPYLTNPTASIQLGMRTWNQVGNPGYGKVGDGFVYGSNEANGINIINRQGTGTEDYIRFYAGQDANGTTSDIHIQGSGSTRGYVGFGTETPTEKVDIRGNSIISGNLSAATVSITTTPTTDQTNTNILVRDSSTGLIKQKTIPNTLSYGIFSQTGETANISGTTEQSIIDGGVGTLTVGANQFQVGDAFTVNINGHLSNNNDNLRLKIKSDSVVLADSGNFNLNTGGSELIFSLQINFIIRKIGGTGTASIFTKGLMTVIKPSNFTTFGFSFEDLNNTTFDSTISNTLDITAQFDATDPTTYIYTDFLVLNKIY
jgi:hypothetical protein